MRVLFVTMIMLAACRKSTADATGGMPKTDTVGDTRVDTAPTDSDTAPPLSLVYWSFDASLVINAGSVDPVASSARVGFWNVGEAEASCVTVLTLDQVNEQLPDDASLVVMGWWRLQLSESVPDSCPLAPPATLWVGIGAVDTLIVPAVEAAELDPAEVYGLYLQQTGANAPTYIYGVAGTAANFDGSEAPVTQAPLPDGVYSLRGLHLLPLGR